MTWSVKPVYKKLIVVSCIKFLLLKDQVLWKGKKGGRLNRNKRGRKKQKNLHKFKCNQTLSDDQTFIRISTLHNKKLRTTLIDLKA